MTMRFPSLCHICKHLHLDGEWRVDRPNRLKCAAYPDGIPDAILVELGDHRKPIEGDHGIQFELRDDAKPEHLEAWLEGRNWFLRQR